MESKQYRIKAAFFDDLDNRKWEIKYRLREEVSESDILNAMCYKYLKGINEKDVLLYWEEVLKKDVGA